MQSIAPMRLDNGSMTAMPQSELPPQQQHLLLQPQHPTEHSNPALNMVQTPRVIQTSLYQIALTETKTSIAEKSAVRQTMSSNGLLRIIQMINAAQLKSEELLCVVGQLIIAMEGEADGQQHNPFLQP